MPKASKRYAGPTRARKQAPEIEEFDTFDEMLGDATADVPPFVMPVPRWDPETDERLPDEKVSFPCPDGDAMEDWNTAARSGDDYAAYIALYGEDVAERLWRATSKRPFTDRAILMSKILVHYQLQAADGMGVNPQS